MTRFTFIAALAAAAAVLSAGSAAAETEAGGYAGLTVGYVDIDLGYADDDAATFGAEGAWATPLGERFGLQIDAGYQRLEGDLADADVVSGAAHIFVRNSETFAAGVFVTASDDDESTFVGGGVEVALYRGGITYDAEFAVLEDDDADAEVVGGAVGATYFPLANMALGGSVSVVNVDASGSDATGYGVGADAEWQIPHTAVSLFAEAGYSSIDDTDVDVAAVMFGVRLNAGGYSLYERDRVGASMKGARRLANAIRF